MMMMVMMMIMMMMIIIIINKSIRNYVSHIDANCILTALYRVK